MTRKYLTRSLRLASRISPDYSTMRTGYQDTFKAVIRSLSHRLSSLRATISRQIYVSTCPAGQTSSKTKSYEGPTNTKPPALSPQPTPDYGIASPPAAGPNCFYLYLPYLNFDTYANIIKRRCIIKRRLKHGRARPVPKDIAELESLELRVIWQYIGFDPPLNCRRTLDQFGYPSLRDTYSRDDDQMLYKLTKRDRPRNRLLPDQNNRMNTSESFVSKKNRLSSMMSGLIRDDDSSSSGSSSSSDGDSDSDSESELDVADQVKEGNVLMVDQLWLWAVDTSEYSLFPRNSARVVF